MRAVRGHVFAHIEPNISPRAVIPAGVVGSCPACVGQGGQTLEVCDPVQLCVQPIPAELGTAGRKYMDLNTRGYYITTWDGHRRNLCQCQESAAKGSTADCGDLSFETRTPRHRRRSGIVIWFMDSGQATGFPVRKSAKVHSSSILNKAKLYNI